MFHLVQSSSRLQVAAESVTGAAPEAVWALVADATEASARSAVLHGDRYLGDHESMHPDQVALRVGSHVAGAQAGRAESALGRGPGLVFGDLGAGGERARGK